MFAPTFRLEPAKRSQSAFQATKKSRFGVARRATPFASLLTCAWTLGLAWAGQAQTPTPTPTSPPPTVIVTAPPNSVIEGASGNRVDANFQVSLSSPATANTTVTLTPQNGNATADNATAGEDFDASPITVTFPTGQTGPIGVPVEVLGDDLNENDETFRLVASSADGSATTTNSAASATIQDDDTAPQLSISDPAPITEGNSGRPSLMFTITLSEVSGQNVTVNFATANDPNASGESAATPGSDFVVDSGSVTIPAGETERSFSISIISDAADETTETFAVNLSGATNATIAVDQAIGTINDDDAPSITVASDPSANEGQDLNFTISLAQPSPDNVTVNYTTRDNTARAGEDYEFTSGTVTFFPGVTNIDIPVATINDQVFEGQEQFTFNLSGASGGATLLRRQGIGTINDDESAPIITVVPASVEEGNAGGPNVPLTFTATLSSASSQTVSFRVATSSGTATSGRDFVAATRTLTFSPGVTSVSFDVAIIGDNLDEVDETFNVILSNASANAGFTGGATTTSTTGTILDNDGPTISFVDRTPNEVIEGGNGSTRNLNFRVRLSNPSNETVSVRFATSRGTTNPATPNSDFTNTSGTLTFAPNDVEQEINVPILGDTVDEPDETFLVTLSRPVGGTLVANQEFATGTIGDDDATPNVSISNVIGNEGNGGRISSFSFVLSLDRPSALTASVDFATNGVTATPSGMTPATPGVDFTTNSGTATFNPGVIRQTVVVQVIGDNLDESTETFTVNLSDLGRQNVNIATRARIGTGTIRDDDATPQLSIETSPLVIVEGGAGGGTPPAGGGTPPPGGATNKLIFNVSLDNASGQDVSFNFQTVQPTTNRGDLRPATQGGDYNDENGRRTIIAGQTSIPIEITLKGDALDEFDEYFTVVISNATGATIRNATGVGVVTDDDAAGTIAIDPPAADRTAIEGGRVATFPVTLSAISGRDVTVNFFISGDGENNQANPRIDLAPIDDSSRRTLVGETSGSITIEAGQTKDNIIIVGLADALDEPLTENFRVRISSISPSEYTTAAGKDSAASTVEDRNAGFFNFSPKEGNQNYGNRGGFGGNGTDVVLTGNQFRINNFSQIREIRVGVIGNDLRTGVAASFFRVESDTSVRVRVPDNARSGRIRIILNDGTILTPSDPNDFDDTFIVNAVVSGFTPEQGVVRTTLVTISGVNLNDPLNPVTGVRFNGILANARNSGRDIEFLRDSVSRSTVIRALVPTGATTGPITLVTANGTIYPPSVNNFTVNAVQPGGLRFAQTFSPTVNENERGNLRSLSTGNARIEPIASYSLELAPARVLSPRMDVAPRGDVTVLVSITDDVPIRQRGRSPEIAVPTGRVVRVSPTQFEVTFEANDFNDRTNEFPTKIINLIDAGDDILPADFVAGGFFQEQNARKLTLSASILRSNDQELYPAGAAASDITINRFDLHGLDTDIGTTLRTTEDQESQANNTNFTRFKLNLRNINNAVDVQGDGRARFVGKKYSASPQPPVLNPDGTVNTDGEPISDVFLPFRVTDPGEALIRYYVAIPDGRGGFTKFYPGDGDDDIDDGDGEGNGGDAVFRPTITVIYASNPARREYYKYDHFVEVRGVDDDIQDGSQSYQIQLDNSEGTAQNPNSNSTDPEFFKLNLVTPFTLTNADNEQSVGSGEPGFIFSRSSGTPLVPRLTTTEAGGDDFFTVRLRQKPSSGRVTLRLQTGNPEEVLFLDPADPNRIRTIETLDLQFFADTQSRYAPNQSRWDTPQTVRVIGVNDEDGDDAQIITLLTSTVDSATNDPAYRTIDPVDPLVTNQSSLGISVSPTNLNILEGTTETFAVSLNSRPNGNVTINLSSSDSTVATLNVNRLTFTPANSATPQLVTVRGVTDRTFARRTATIVTSAASSSDPDFNGFDVPDIEVTVENRTTAFTITPDTATTTGLTTSEDGLSDTFSVRLASAPTATVVLTLSNSSAETILSAAGQRSESVELTFTPQNFGRPQTVTVIGQDDEATDGNQSFDISGFVVSEDANFTNQPFPSILGTNLDNDGTSTGESITFAANGTYTVSFPFATSDGTLTKAQAFSAVSGGGAPNFTLYRFNVAGQRNSRALSGGTDFVAVGANEKLVRGIGYRLVTGAQAVRLNTPSDGGGLSAFSGSTFTLNLNWNPNFLSETSSPDNRFNGYNLIGFPFDPAQFSRVSFVNARVQYGSQVYESVADAAAAGIIGRQLFTVDAQGNLSEASTGDLQLRPYRAYFVRIFRNEFPVVLTLRNPTD